MEFGIQLYSLRERAAKDGAEKLLKMVSEAGYDGVEFAGFYGLNPEKVAELLNKYNLTPISAHIGLNDIEANLPYIDYLKIKHVFIPWIGAESFSDKEAFAELTAKTREIKAILDRRGVTLGYHNHNHEFKDGNDFVTQYIKAVEGLKLELDVFWATVAGLNAVSTMKKYKGALEFLHIKEAAAVNPVEKAQPIVGEGAVGMKEVFLEAAAQNINYAILEVEKVDCSEEEYISKSLVAMKAFAKEAKH